MSKLARMLFLPLLFSSKPTVPVLMCCSPYLVIVHVSHASTLALSEQDVKADNGDKIASLLEKSIKDVQDTKATIHRGLFSSMGRFIVVNDHPTSTVKGPVDFELPKMSKKNKIEDLRNLGAEYLEKLFLAIIPDVNAIQSGTLLPKLEKYAGKSNRQFVFVIRLLEALEARLTVVQDRVQEVQELSAEEWGDADMLYHYLELLLRTTKLYEVSEIFTNLLENTFVPASSPSQLNDVYNKLQDKVLEHQEAVNQKLNEWRRFMRNVKVSSLDDEIDELDLDLMDFWTIYWSYPH